MAPKHILAFQRRLLRWYEERGRDLPWRRTSDPYAILVSEIMLQQTQVSAVRPYYHRWLERFPTFAALASSSEEQVLHAWQGLGYYTRARNLRATAKAVVNDYNGVLPRNPGLLRRLPGMGRYTANAVATFAFDQPLPILEANTGRVLARLFDVRLPIDSTPGRERLWETAATLVPQHHPAMFNSAMIDLGALVCVSPIPKCESCPVQSFCRAPNPELLPVKKPRKQLKRLTESHALALRPGKILLERCSTRWRGMWMLPAAAEGVVNQRPVYSSVFPFTNHRISLRVFRAEVVGKRSACPTTANHRQRTAAIVGQALHLSNKGTEERKKREQRWIRINKLSEIPIPSPHRRAITALLRPD